MVDVGLFSSFCVCYIAIFGGFAAELSLTLLGDSVDKVRMLRVSMLQVGGSWGFLNHIGEAKRMV